jgi:hypothetical protein
MTSVIVRLVGDSLSSEVSRPGSMAAAVYSVSQKPLIITKTCRKLGRFGPLNNSMMGDLLSPSDSDSAAASKTSDSATEVT